MSSLNESNGSKGPIAWMAGHSVAANLVMALCLVGGYFSMRNIKQEVFPDTAVDEVRISVAYPGASPEEVESGILLAVEEAIRSLDGISEITSAANEGSGAVTAELLIGADPESVARDIQSEVDRITTFPEDAEDPQVTVPAHRREVLDVVLYGQVETKVLFEAAERVRDELLQDPEITQAEVEGLPPLEIMVDASQESLRRYGLAFDELASRIRNGSMDVPGGGVKARSGEILLRVTERRDLGREFAELPVITTPEGGSVKLGQIAEVRDGFSDADRYDIYNGEPSATIEVYRVGDQTPISVSDAVHSRLEEITDELPEGLSAVVQRDRSETYRQRLDLLLKNGLYGLVLVICLLGIFLEARLAFWVMMGIPISFMGSFLLLPSTGVTINMMSLFAYLIALGIVVDDAIVVGENIYHYHQEGMEFLDAATKGAREVALPVVFSILTNIATFIPLYFVPGHIGIMFKMIPLVVCVVFMISLAESLFVLPAHLGHTKEKERHGLTAWLHGRQQAFSRGFLSWVRNTYGPFLAFTLRYRYITLACAISILFTMISYAKSGRLGFQLFPKVESDYSQADFTLPYGTPVERTDAVAKRIIKGADKVIKEIGRPELVRGVSASIGIGGSNNARVRVEFAEPDIRNEIISNEEFTNRWRNEVGEVVGVEFMKFASDSGGPGGWGRPVTVELNHRNVEVLSKASSELAEILEGYPLVKDVDDGFQPGKPQLDFTLTDEGKSLGLTARDVARQVRAAFQGVEVLRQQRGRHEIKVTVRLPDSERDFEQTVNDLMLKTPGGGYVPLRHAASFTRGRAYTTIDRRGGKRVVQVTADMTDRSKSGEILADLEENAMPGLMAKYNGLHYSFEGHQADTRESLGSLKLTFILALLAIYAMLAIPFRSYVQPFIVMFSIPFGIVGAFLGHMIMGYSLSILSMFGIVALSGVVVNDSLVMVDFANRLRLHGYQTGLEAVHAAAIQRFRPIMLTTVTTFGGLVPMILETSRQARFLIPMALSLGFGVLFATVITLVIVPSLYVAVEDFKAGWQWVFNGVVREQGPGLEALSEK